MNRSELAALSGAGVMPDLQTVHAQALKLARSNQREVFVTLSELGMLGAAPDGKVIHLPCHPIRGAIDIVGAGDAVTANLSAALAAGASTEEALEIANAAASIVVHQLGTTGTADVTQIRKLLGIS